jgi:hypothetical protein
MLRGGSVDGYHCDSLFRVNEFIKTQTFINESITF